MRLTTTGPEETLTLGEALGRRLQAGDVVTLSGEMGAGKTVLAQAICTGLGVDEPVSSPTFALVHEYAGRVPVWHLDVYRLSGPGELLDLSWPELLAGGGVVLIEWPERIAEALPDERLELTLAYGDGDSREIEVGARGARMTAVVMDLARPTEPA